VFSPVRDANVRRQTDILGGRRRSQHKEHCNYRRRQAE